MRCSFSLDTLLLRLSRELVRLGVGLIPIRSMAALLSCGCMLGRRVDDGAFLALKALSLRGV